MILLLGYERHREFTDRIKTTRTEFCRAFEHLESDLFPLLLLISTSSLKSEIADIEESTDYLNYTASEILELKQIISTQDQPKDSSITPSTPPKEIAQKYLATSNIREESYSIQEPRADTVSIFLTKISLRQIMRLLYSLETSPGNLDVLQVDMDTKSDPKGFLWSTILFRKRAEPKKQPTKESNKKSFTR